MQKINKEWIEAAVLGGAILGGGGGGSLEEGRRLGKLALELGHPTVIDLDRLPKNSLVLTVSAVGAPSMGKYPLLSHYIRPVQMVIDSLGCIGGMMTNELGGLAVVNGLVQSAMLEIPLVDAACNGRAHPTGAMGSMGLSMDDRFVSHQAAAGEDSEDGRYIELYAKGSLSAVSKVIRKAAEEAGGTVAVARNPVSTEYVRKNAAVGALSEAVRIGEAYLKRQTGVERAEKVVEALGGTVIVRGKVDGVELASRGGFDVGGISVGDYKLTFWNEYMTLEQAGTRLATFPDLIMTMEAQSGYPITTAEIQQGQEVIVIAVPGENLNLGAGMKDPRLFHEVEEVIDMEVVKYVFSRE